MDINELLQEYMGSHRGPGPDDPGPQGTPGEPGESWIQAQRDEMIEIVWKNAGKEPMMEKDEKNEYMIHYSCPTCGNHLLCSDGYKGSGTKTNYCPDCGQKFDWRKIPNYKWL